MRLWLCSLCVGAMLLTGGESTAQSRRKARPQATPRVAVALVVDSLQQQYNNYQLREASKNLDLLAKVPANDSLPNLNLYRERIERAERMLPKAEQLPLLYKVSGYWRTINEQFQQYYRDVNAAKLEFNPHNGRKYWSCNQLRGGNELSFGYCTIYDTDKGDIRLVEPDFKDEDSSKLLEAINRADSDEDFPFVLSDGVRLIFGSNRPEGLGGYDLYMSRYSIERGVFLEPSLLPMPYNSPANDYLLVCDEDLGRTFLVSDRDSKEGEVTLFVFEGLPDFVTAKKSPEASEQGEELITQALLRQTPGLSEDTSLIIKRESVEEAIFLPLNAGVQIRSWEDFRSNEAKELYKNYLEGERKQEHLAWGQRYIMKDLKAGKLSEQEAKTKYAEVAIQARELRKEQAKRLIEVKNTEIKYRQQN